MKLKTLIYFSLLALVASFVPSAHAQTFSVIHAFQHSEGAYPYAGVTLRGGILYGTTILGGKGAGSVYQVTHTGSTWLTVSVYLFGNDEGFPLARVVFGQDGHPYGTASGFNGRLQVSPGAVFDLTSLPTICKTANCFWKQRVLHSFTDHPTDGAVPSGDLVWDLEGNIYGTTQTGSVGSADLGTVFQMTKAGDTWTETPIWSFSYTDGAIPMGGVIFDSNSSLLGTTQHGGANDRGAVFRLTPSGNTWTETNLYDFQGGMDGGYPSGGLLMDRSRNLYGTTSAAGSRGGGTVFELTPAGNGYTFKLLYSFSGPPGGQCGPNASLSMDAAGNIYGTTVCDGPLQDGNVFRLTNTENGWVYTSLHDFTGGADGSEPVSSVTIDTDGTLYGTATNGGNRSYCVPAGCGVVWMIKP